MSAGVYSRASAPRHRRARCTRWLSPSAPARNSRKVGDAENRSQPPETIAAKLVTLVARKRLRSTRTPLALITDASLADSVPTGDHGAHVLDKSRCQNHRDMHRCKQHEHPGGDEMDG